MAINYHGAENNVILANVFANALYAKIQQYPTDEGNQEWLFRHRCRNLCCCSRICDALLCKSVAARQCRGITGNFNKVKDRRFQAFWVMLSPYERRVNLQIVAKKLSVLFYQAATNQNSESLSHVNAEPSCMTMTQRPKSIAL